MPNSVFFFARLEIAKNLLILESQKVVIFRIKFLNLFYCGSAKHDVQIYPVLYLIIERVYFYICRGISGFKTSSENDPLWYCILVLLLSKVTFSWMLLTLALSLSMSVCSLDIVVLSSFSLSLAKTSSRVHSKYEFQVKHFT